LNPGGAELTWPGDQAGEALVQSARAAGLSTRAVAQARPSPAALAAPLELLPALAERLGLEAIRHDLQAAALGEALAGAELAVVPVGGRWLAVARGKVIAADGGSVKLGTAALRRLAAGEHETAARERILPFLDRAGLEPKARAAAADALLDQELMGLRLPSFELRLPASAPWWQLARAAGLFVSASRLLLVDLLALVLFILSWRVLGGALLAGRGEPAQLWPWLLLLFSLVPLHRASRRIEAGLAIAAGRLLKERLLAGTLRLKPDTLLAEGASGLLGRVLEAEALETALLGGGLFALVAAVELLGALVLLVWVGLPWAALALALGLLLAGLLLAGAWPRLAAWTAHRLAITGGLVENMVGQRTRLAQLPEERWHEAEDQELRAYHRLSQRRDRAEWALLTLLPQGFLLVAILALAPAFLGDESTAGALAGGLGACLLAQNALRRLAAAFWQLADAGVAWREAKPLLAAADAERAGEPSAEPGEPLHALAPVAGELLLAARELRFGYPDSEVPVLRGATLEVRGGERILLSGASGGGKSTLIALLAGLRRPHSGLLLAGGLDLPTLGAAGFRRRVALAPQFHQNHVFTGPLAFNLLMGHRDPTSDAAQAEALAICRELGLEPLLERMPGGMGQMVGETGWQLSHGERSRIFLARALLQGAPVVVLDESLGALDPESFDLALDCLAKRAQSLILVAHP
jgi:ATP-binding cassette subfamily B protein